METPQEHRQDARKIQFIKSFLLLVYYYFH